MPTTEVAANMSNICIPQSAKARLSAVTHAPKRPPASSSMVTQASINCRGYRDSITCLSKNSVNTCLKSASLELGICGLLYRTSMDSMPTSCC
uniref:Uncharacterized protein n=1 Tax=Babesia bovis TaxID=5865 RepID=S6CAS1_BABBO|nr:hypothetical protein [Babesia bovis]